LNKNQVMELLNEIVASYPALAVDGFYTREIRSSTTGDVELRLLTSLDRESRKHLNPIIENRGLRVIVEKNLLIIY